MDGEDGGGVRDSTFHAGGRVAAHVVVDAADNDGGAVGAAARAFLLKLSAPEIPRRSLAHGRAESKKAIGPRGKKEGREGGREEEAKEEAEAGAEELRFRPHHHHRTCLHRRRCRRR